MNKLFLLFITLIIKINICIAQSPELINFQAIISSENESLDSTDLDLRFYK